MNQASMFFTAIVMLAGAGWYMMAKNPDMLPARAAAEANVKAPKTLPLLARGPAPIAAKMLPVEEPPAGK